MKLSYMTQICTTVKRFEQRIIAHGECLSDCLMQDRLRVFADKTTEQDDDTIDVDFEDMCFTLERVSDGMWGLCPVATYYIYNDNGTLIKDEIEVELD